MSLNIPCLQSVHVQRGGDTFYIIDLIRNVLAAVDCTEVTTSCQVQSKPKFGLNLTSSLSETCAAVLSIDQQLMKVKG